MAVTRVVSATIGGKVVEFKKLTVGQLVDLQAVSEARERAEIIEDGKSCGLQPEQIAERIAEFREKRRMGTSVVRYALTMAGALDVVKRSAAVSGIDESIIDTMDPVTTLYIAAEMAGLEPTKPEETEIDPELVPDHHRPPPKAGATTPSTTGAVAES